MILFTLSRHLRVQSLLPIILLLLNLFSVIVVREKQHDSALLFYSDVFRFAFAQL